MAGKRQRFLKIAGLMLCAAIAAFNYSAKMEAVRALPDTVYGANGIQHSLLGVDGRIFTLNTEGEDAAAVTADMGESLGGEYKKVTVELFGLIPVREISAYVPENRRVMPGGCAVGIAMYTDGLLVVGLGGFYSNGARVCPAEAAGLRAGDIIVSVGGMEADSTGTLYDVISDGRAVNIVYIRGGKEHTAQIAPLPDDDTGRYSAGMWIRESTVGIGMLSFCDNESKRFGALGHAVTDIDTGTILQVGDGNVLCANVLGISVGTQGDPGAIRGAFNSLSGELGDITENTELGIFGSIKADWVNPIYPEGLEVALPTQVQAGPATILTTVDGEGVREYSCEIIKLYEQATPEPKSMVIRVTDEALLNVTGGIVQGMSGSPIVQNGKLAGVVTHVFLNDPTKGYGIYAMWMTGG